MRIWDVVGPDGDVVGAIHADLRADAQNGLYRDIAEGKFPILSRLVLNNTPKTIVPRGRHAGYRKADHA